jgi:WD40 repeat protein
MPTARALFSSLALAALLAVGGEALAEAEEAPLEVPSGLRLSKEGEHRLTAVFGGYRLRAEGPALALSASGKALLTGGGDGAVRLFETETGLQTKLLRAPLETPRCAAFSPDAKTVAAGGSNGSVALWDLESGTLRHLLRRNGGEALALTFSRDGRRLVTGGEDGTLRVWDAHSGKLLRSVAAHDGWIRAIVPMGPDRAVSGGIDGALKLWDLAGGKLLRTLAKAGEPAIVAVAAAGESVLVGDEQGGVRRIGLDGASAVVAQGLTQILALGCADGEPRCRIAALRPSQSGQELWLTWLEAGAAEPSQIAHRPPGGARRALLSADGTLLVTESSRGLALWDARTLEQLGGSSGHSAAISSLAVAPRSGFVLSTARDGTARLWSSDGEAELVMDDLGANVCAAAFSPDGMSAIAADMAGNRLLLDLPSRKVTRVPGAHRGLAAVGFGAGGKGVSASYERMASWSVQSGEESGVAWFGRAASAIAFSGDGSASLVAGGAEAQLRSVDTGKVVKTIKRKGARWSACALSNDAATAAVALELPQGAVLEIWDLAKPRRAMALPKRPGSIESLSLSRDGSLLLAAYSDGAVRLWDTRSGSDLFEVGLHGNGEKGTALAFFAGGRSFLVGTSSGAILRFDPYER